MLTYYPSNPNISHSKKQSYTPSIEAKISHMYDYNQNKRNQSPLYAKKSTSLDKSLLRSKYNTASNFAASSSVSKQIKGKKLASSQYNNSSFKGESNGSLNQMNYSTYINYKDPSVSFINEKKVNITEGKDGKYTLQAENKSSNLDKQRRKKILTVNTDINDNVRSFLNGKDYKGNYNPTDVNQANYLLGKKDQPLKIYTDSNVNNDTETNISFNKVNENQNQIGMTTDSNSCDSNNRNSFSKSYNNDGGNSNSDKNSFNKLTQKSFNRQLNEIELRLEKALLDNKTNSKSKKYNTIKHSFEEVLLLLPAICNSNLFKKILVGYHGVMTDFSTETKKFKDNYEEGNKNYEKLKKTLYDYQKQSINQQNEINVLKKRIIELEKMKEQYHFSKGSGEEESTQIQANSAPGTDKDIISNDNKENEEINDKHNHILHLNKNNVTDLDALYFFDKVDMRPRSSSSSSKVIPRLDLNRHTNPRQESKSKVTVTMNNIPNKLKNMGDFNILNNSSYIKSKYKKF